MHLPVNAAHAPLRTRPSNYPQAFAARMEGRSKRPLGELFGLKNFAVNFVELAPGAVSALHHVHSTQDEFVLVLSGFPMVIVGEVETTMQPGMAVGFPANGLAHHLENRTQAPATYLEVGDRTPGDTAAYPKDDLVGVLTEQGWSFTHRDGRPW